MKKLFATISTLEKFKKLKLSIGPSDDECIFWGSPVVMLETPDVKWDLICFIEDVGLIYVKKHMYANMTLSEIPADFQNIISNISNRLTVLELKTCSCQCEESDHGLFDHLDDIHTSSELNCAWEIIDHEEEKDFTYWDVL